MEIPLRLFNDAGPAPRFRDLNYNLATRRSVKKM
jgi:hypothetical protein